MVVGGGNAAGNARVGAPVGLFVLEQHAKYSPLAAGQHDTPLSEDPSTKNAHPGFAAHFASSCTGRLVDGCDEPSSTRKSCRGNKGHMALE